MSNEKMYSIAIRKRNDENDFFWDHDNYIFKELRFDHRNRFWIADPFLFEKGEDVFVFYEAFDLIERKGKIGFSLLNEPDKTMSVQIILDEPYHLSFPYVFEHEGDIFMMPETCGNNSIKLFKAISFPDKWIEFNVLLSNIFACDTIFIPEHGMKYLLTSEMYSGQTPNGNYKSCWVKNVCFKLNKEFLIDGKGALVTEGDCGIRNAGKTFVRGGKLYRVGQNCPNKQYGKGLVLFEIESLAPYKENLLWIKNHEDFDEHIHKLEKYDIVGVHTYNVSEKFEIIDFSQFRALGLITLLLRFCFICYCKLVLILWSFYCWLKRLILSMWNFIIS